MADRRTHFFGFERMAPVMPPGQLGTAEIDHFTITGREFLGLGRFDRITPGTYARLKIRGDVMMSDTQMEQFTNADALMMAKGRVLIAGLGLGMLLYPMLFKCAVESVTVIESNRDVIELVDPRLRCAVPHRLARKLTIVHGDARTWRPEQDGRDRPRFDAIWLDIWGHCSTDDLDDMRVLRRRYRRWLAPDGWLGSWWWEHLHEIKRERGW